VTGEDVLDSSQPVMWQRLVKHRANKKASRKS